jgi:hypothetical protein
VVATSVSSAKAKEKRESCRSRLRNVDWYILVVFVVI